LSEKLERHGLGGEPRLAEGKLTEKVEEIVNEIKKYHNSSKGLNDRNWVRRVEQVRVCKIRFC
jgi:hypothetical protein